MEIANVINPVELESRVKDMYQKVAQQPQGAFHFEMGRGLAERLGYPARMLEWLPAPAVDSFAGVGYHFGLAGLEPGENVLDLGSGSGMDAFFAATQVGPEGEVLGVDMTTAQLAKAKQLAERHTYSNTYFLEGYIEKPPVVRGCMDVVISNGVINLSSDKARVFQEAARVLRRGGRLAISDIVTESQLPERITCNVDLWAACIGGAVQQDDYFRLIEMAGFRILAVQENPMYAFLSRGAKNASERYGVKSVSLLAEKL